MEHACQLQISTSPSPIAVVQKAVRIFNWKAQKSKKRTTTQAREQQQLLPASGQQSGAHTHAHTLTQAKSDAPKIYCLMQATRRGAIEPRMQHVELAEQTATTTTRKNKEAARRQIA